jgi:hypothetical protein
MSLFDLGTDVPKIWQLVGVAHQNCGSRHRERGTAQQEVVFMSTRAKKDARKGVIISVSGKEHAEMFTYTGRASSSSDPRKSRTTEARKKTLRRLLVPLEINPIMSGMMVAS